MASALKKNCADAILPKGHGESQCRKIEADTSISIQKPELGQQE
jgi:hypothetical protein